MGCGSPEPEPERASSSIDGSEERESTRARVRRHKIASRPQLARSGTSLPTGGFATRDRSLLRRRERPTHLGLPAASPPRPERDLGPGLRIIGLVGLAVVALLASSWWALGSLASVPVLWWVAHGRNPLRLLRFLRRTAWFLLFLVVSFLIVPPATAHPWMLHIAGRHINVTGLGPGVRMSLRLLTIVLGSIVLRETGRRGELLIGLRQLRLPLPVAQTIDAALSLVGEMQGGRRRGQRRREREGRGLRGVLRSDKEAAAARLLESFEDTVARSEDAIGKSAQPDTMGIRVSSDAAVVAALAVMAMTVKFAKILPGIPFASGHKNMLTIPLYFAAARLTRSRLGATWMGITLGVVAFMFGEGRFGIIEIVKYVAPGVVLDAVWPFIRYRRNVVLLSILGLVMAFARFGSTLLAGWIAHAPPLFYALAGGASVTQFIFGLLSGPVSWAVLRSIDRADVNRILHGPRRKAIPMPRAKGDRKSASVLGATSEP
jgi:cobalt transport protein